MRGAMIACCVVICMSPFVRGEEKASGNASGTESLAESVIIVAEQETALEAPPKAPAQRYTPEQGAALRERANKLRAEFDKALPPGSWEREKTNIVLESGRSKLIFKKYQVLPNGRVKLEPCTLVVLPGNECLAPDLPWYLSDVPPGGVTVYRMPEGVVLESEAMRAALKNSKEPIRKEVVVPDSDRR